MGKFVITKRSNGEFQFNLKAGNGQTILASEGYTTKASCENGIESVRKNAFDFTDSMPLSREAVLSYISLLPMTCPLPALRVK